MEGDAGGTLGVPSEPGREFDEMVEEVLGTSYHLCILLSSEFRVKCDLTDRLLRYRGGTQAERAWGQRGLSGSG